MPQRTPLDTLLRTILYPFTGLGPKKNSIPAALHARAGRSGPLITPNKGSLRCFSWPSLGTFYRPLCGAPTLPTITVACVPAV